MSELVFGGKQATCAKASKGKRKKMLQQDKNISASEKLRRKIQKQNS